MVLKRGSSGCVRSMVSSRAYIAKIREKEREARSVGRGNRSIGTLRNLMRSRLEGRWVDDWVCDLSNGQKALYKCTSEGNTPM